MTAYTLTQEQLIALVTKAPKVVMALPEEVRADVKIMTAAVKKNGLLLQECSNEIRANRDVVLEAVGQNGEALEFASDELRDDQEVVKKAVSKSGQSIRFASDRWRADLEMATIAVNKDQYAYAYGNFAEEIRSNKELALSAIRKGLSGGEGDPHIQEHLPETLAKDPDIWAAIVHENQYWRNDVPEEIVEMVRPLVKDLKDACAKMWQDRMRKRSKYHIQADRS